MKWVKEVIAEDDKGIHVKLHAVFSYLNVIEARTRAGWERPLHMKLGAEILSPASSDVYVAEHGRLFVVFDWKKRNDFLLIEDD